MLEEKAPVSDMQGRIETLQERFDRLRTPPEHLDAGAKEAWGSRVRQADSILSALRKRTDTLGKKDRGPSAERVRIDRTLQRLGIQARSMEKAFKKDRQRKAPAH